MTIKVAVVGGTGRMGKLALDIIDAAQDLHLHASLNSTSDLAEAIGADLIFDVTNLEVSKKVVEFAIAKNLNVLVGTSGWTKAALVEVENKMSSGSAVVVVPNFSIGSTLATKFAAEAGKYFDSIEIIETHHAGKVDSPSGTAIRTAELISESRSTAGKTQPLIPGVGQTARGEVVSGIPIHSLRVDGVSAKQEVVLGGAAEVLTLSHEASSVQAYALGILHSIRFAATANGVVVGLDKVLGI